MLVSSKFLTESTGEKIVQIGKYLAKIRAKNDSLVFLGHPVYADASKRMVLRQIASYTDC